jgi:hypothetical protein
VRTRLTVVAALLAAVILVVPATGSGSGAPALSCGLPRAQPVWIDFADHSVSFWRERFARPGVVVATGGPDIAREARSAGAATVHWDMHLNKRVGTPSRPNDPETMDRRADTFYEYAVSVTGCQQPLIALNEVSGASLPAPLTPTVERYRDNVLRFVTRLSQRGARPALLLPSEPFLGGGAEDWWRTVAQVSDLVLQKYPSAKSLWREGVVDASRRLRVSYRKSVTRLIAIGIQPSRVGLVIGFQTGLGKGGREGLRPRAHWFEVVKWQAFAAREVSRELGLSHIWSWGWAQRNASSNDPDKTDAACVWLWARSPGLCDAPKLLGSELSVDRTAGQIMLPGNARCLYDGKPLTAAAVSAVSKVTGDRELALTALVVRAVERGRTHVTRDEIAEAERRLVLSRFRGSRRAYRRALADVGAGAAVGRAIVGDELRRSEILSRLRGGRPSSAEVRGFRETYGEFLARRVRVTPAPSWLPEGTGVAVATSAPDRVFRIGTGRTATVRTLDGVFSVEALDDALPLGVLPVADSRNAVVRELRRLRREAAYERWTLAKQKGAVHRLICERDRMPTSSVVTLSSYVPFLAAVEPGSGSAASTPTG